MPIVDPRIVAAFSAHAGVLTRRQAVELGLSGSDIDHMVRRGGWVAVRRGVYATRKSWDALDEHRGRPLLLARAASAAMLTPHVMSHDSAALELQMPILAPSPLLVHVTRFGVLGSRTEHGIKHHLAPFIPEQITFVGDRPVLNLARTACDIAREHGVLRGAVAADSALRMGASRTDLAHACDPMRNWPNVTIVRTVVDLADPGSESVGESMARLLVLELGIGRPQTQFGLRDGGRKAWCDLRVGRHIFEFDGRVKYLAESDGGVATKDANQVLWEEKQRQDFICGFKLGMSRIVYADLWGQARDQAKRRLMREYLDTQARFGDSIADLAPYIVRKSG